MVEAYPISRLDLDVRRELCRLVREKTRSSDYLGTFGDSGYLVVLPHADADRAEAVAARILKDFGALAVESGRAPSTGCGRRPVRTGRSRGPVGSGTA